MEKTKVSRISAGTENDPATERQLAFLEELEITAPEGLTKAQASELIDKGIARRDRQKNLATDDQKRRLRFYQIEFDDEELTKREAMRLIDEYVSDNPASESEYRAWKRSLPEWDQYGEVHKPPTSEPSSLVGFVVIACTFCGGLVGQKLGGHWAMGAGMGFVFGCVLAAKLS